MRLRTLVSPLFLAALSTADPSSASGSGDGLDPPGLLPLINRANVLLSAGQFNEAARSYTEAIEQAPSDYLLYYKRATAYFSSNRHPNALEDFDKVLELTASNYHKAFLMKGKIHAREGQWVEARDMVKRYNAKQQTADPAAADLLFSVSEAEVATKKAAQAQRAGLWTACVEDATQALATASHSVTLRQQRADCALAAGEVEQSVGDLIRLTHITAPTTSLLLRIARISYFLLPNSGQAQSTLKQCLHFDPDSKPCASLHRQIKKFDKSFSKLTDLLDASKWVEVIKLVYGSSTSETGDGLLSEFDTVLTEAASALDLPPSLADVKKTSARRQTLVRALCKAYVSTEQFRKCEKWCTELLNMSGAGDDIDGLIGSGEAARAREDWEEAVRVLEKAFEVSGRSSNDIAQKLQRAKKLLKQSKQKDYYKVLDVSRDADQKTIKKAYRKAAMTSHPDKGGSEQKMAAVNEAYEVLSDPELRQRFDNGDDPNDTSSQGNPFFQGAGGGGFPYQQFFGGARHGPSSGFKFQYTYGH